MSTTLVSPDEVRFPLSRKEQASDLMALSGDALLRGDRMAWAILLRASKEIENEPEFDSPKGREKNMRMQTNISMALGGFFGKR